MYMIVILTGATEVFQKLPTLLLTTLKCLPEDSFLIFSDLEQEVAGVPVRDALVDVSEAMKTSVADFEMYRQINATYAEAGDMSALNDNWKAGTIGGSTTQAIHVLDKWKWLPSLAASYDLLEEQSHFASKSKHPKTKKKWVFVMNTNTHLSMLNLMLWLTELEKRWPEGQEGRLIYAGAQLSAGITEYAHGDGGVLLSIPVIERISGLMQMRLAKGDWEKRINMGCCGDIILAEALVNQGVSLWKAFPLLQTGTVASLDWSSRHWCFPVISWRESMPQGLEALWNFERYWIGLWGWEQPILYRDVFAAFIQPRLEVEKAGWINLSEEVAEIVVNPEGTERSHLQEMGSKDICRSVCETRQDCLQWMWRNKVCTVSNVVKLGRRETQQRNGVEDDKTQVISGWMLDRINEWTMNANRECKEESRWILNN